MNTVAWVSRQTHVLGGAYVSATATLPIAANSLTSDDLGAVSGGSGFGDSFFQPLILAWRLTRLDSRVALGFLAPTGRYTAGRSDNVGSGYWTWVASTGQTVYLTRSRATALSAFLMYEFHGTQEGTGIHPGQNLNLDYSITQQFRAWERSPTPGRAGRVRPLANHRQDRARLDSGGDRGTLPGLRTWARVQPVTPGASGKHGDQGCR